MQIATSSAPASPAAYLPSPAGRVAVPAQPTDLPDKVKRLCEHIEARGLIFEPWQIAAFVTAIRTKPFVILAGISGTGKTKLTRAVAELSSSEFRLSPVKPDWTDSTEVVGFEGLDGKFRPGPLLVYAQDAENNQSQEFFFLLDEMNIARVEYYFAEVLSLIEDRRRTAANEIVSEPIVTVDITDLTAQGWRDVAIPSNLAFVGSVNMDETTHGFSRKVLDRAFVLEFSDVDLNQLGTAGAAAADQWSAQDWAVQYLSLNEVPAPHPPVVADSITILTELNGILRNLYVQAGYRVRDEIALFCMNADDCADSFVTRGGDRVDPLDLAIAMKVLPRVQGGGKTVQSVLDSLIQLAQGNNALGRPLPICLARLENMMARFRDEGFTSYWV